MNGDLCPLCQKPVKRFTQSGYLHLPSREYATCENRLCALEGATHEVGAWDRMTFRQASGYLAVKARRAKAGAA